MNILCVHVHVHIYALVRMSRKCVIEATNLHCENASLIDKQIINTKHVEHTQQWTHGSIQNILINRVEVLTLFQTLFVKEHLQIV